MHGCRRCRASGNTAVAGPGSSEATPIFSLIANTDETVTNLHTCDEARRIAAQYSWPRNNAFEWSVRLRGDLQQGPQKSYTREVVAALMFAACILLAIAIAFTL